MKKSLIALAVLAASGAAMAQSTVTMYGIVDMYYANVRQDGAATQNKLESGALNQSRWGMKGSEDLGGGLKANFELVAGFSADTGAAGTLATPPAPASSPAAFSRQSWVGFSGGFGAVRLGRTFTPFDDVSSVAEGVFDSKVSAQRLIFRTMDQAGAESYISNPNNQIYYQAPTFGGFSGAVAYSFGEDAAPGVSASKYTSANATYAGGPLAASVGYQTETRTAGGSTSRNYTRLNLAYNFGVVTLKGAYGKAGNIGAVSGRDASEYAIGVDYPASAALILSANYAKSDANDQANTAGIEDKHSIGLAAKYTLSARTFLWTGYNTRTSTNVAAADVTTKTLAAGVQHRF